MFTGLCEIKFFIPKIVGHLKDDTEKTFKPEFVCLSLKIYKTVLIRIHNLKATQLSVRHISKAIYETLVGLGKIKLLAFKLVALFGIHYLGADSSYIPL